MAAKKKNSAVELVSQADPRAPLDGALLLSQAQKLLGELEADLLVRARQSAAVQEALRVRHEAERAARRTADALEVWERHFVTQVAASWVLSCVFVRTLEDRGLLGHNRIAGPGAADSQRIFFELAPSLTEREYLLSVFRELTRLPAARDLFDARHNPVWLLGPSAGLAKKLLTLFRTPNGEAPGFRFGQADTRFLGDLYQDLSADVRERFALLQTPHFIEKYILDRTLERAIARFGLDETTLIDPTCGSGHCLLGAFERLFDHRLRKEPGLDVREAARRALDAVYGADINPYAVGIARFRLTLAFLEKAGYARLVDAPALPLHLVVADSLLHNPQHGQGSFGELEGQSGAGWRGEEFALEDEAAARDVLYRRFAAVVGNPPYITPKDRTLRQRYAESYPSCFMNYALTVPFTERFFQLARPGGFVGKITANSFMKREFGKKLIESFLPTVNVDGVVNTSGAYIPGHGTPTVLLFGAHEAATGNEVLTVLAKRGEPSTPEDAEHGAVWSSIAVHGSEFGFEDEYISVARISRSTLGKHPWSLGGGGAADLKELLEARSVTRLADVIDDVGFSIIVGEDEVFLRPAGALRTRDLPTIPIVVGELVRDWSLSISEDILRPFDPETLETMAPLDLVRELWPWRTTLENRVVSGSTTMKESNRQWYDVRRLSRDKHRTKMSIVFAFVATHNHFVLDRGGKVFNRTAPIVKLKEGATEGDHLALLAYLNSSTACFWMKQVMMDKGATSDRGVLQADPEKFRFEHDGTKLATIPVPAQLANHRDGLIVEYSRRLDAAGFKLATSPFESIIAESSPEEVVERVNSSIAERDLLRSKMVSWQEEVDWLVYEVFGLLPPDDDAKATNAPDGVAGREPDERAYRRPESDLPRAKSIATNPLLALVERPEFKRRWFRSAGAFDAENVTDLMRVEESAWYALLTVLEKAFDKIDPARLTSLVSASGSDSACHAAAAILRREFEQGLVRTALEREAAPFLAAYRHTQPGLEKRAQWERVWDLQRAEDRGEKVPPFDPAPKYDQKDYRHASSWRLRGKLDVPKERFISYPGCESDEDKEPVYGWAGWNHLQQAQALAALYNKRKQESWTKERLTPMLAGLLELIPWLKQWHNEPSAEFDGLRLGDSFEAFLDGECHTLGVTREALRAWRPEEKGKGKKAKAQTKGDLTSEDDAEVSTPAKPRARRKSSKTATPIGSERVVTEGEPK